VSEIEKKFPLQQRDCETLLLALSGKPLKDWNAVACLKEKYLLDDNGELTSEGLVMARTVQRYVNILHINGISIFDRTQGHTSQLHGATWRSGELFKVPIVLTDSLILQESKAPVWLFSEPLGTREQKALENEVKKFYRPKKWWPLRPSAYQIGGGLPGALQTIVFRIRKQGSPGKRPRVMRIQSCIYDLLVEQAQGSKLTWWLHPNFDKPVIAVKTEGGELEGFMAFVKPLQCDGWPEPEAGKL